MVPVWFDKSSLTKERWRKWDGFMENISTVNNLGYYRKHHSWVICVEGRVVSLNLLFCTKHLLDTPHILLNHFWQFFMSVLSHVSLMSVTFILSHVCNLVIFPNTNQCQMSRNSLLIFQWSTYLQKIPCALGFLYGLIYIFGLWFIVLQAFVS